MSTILFKLREWAYNGPALEARPQLFNVASRFAALTVSVWSAMLGLFVEESLTARIQISSSFTVIDGLHYIVLAVSALGLADIVWHDIGGRLIWPSFDATHRHGICVLIYAVLGGVWLIKAFATVASNFPGNALLAAYAMSMAGVCGLVTVAITLEQR